MSGRRWRRIEAGVYESEDGQHRIIRVYHEQVGPAGGGAWLWEHAQRHGDAWDITSKVTERRLRDAKREVDRRFP